MKKSFITLDPGGRWIQALQLHVIIKQVREHSGSVVECLTQDRGAGVIASPVSLCCVLEQDTFILA